MTYVVTRLFLSTQYLGDELLVLTENFEIFQGLQNLPVVEISDQDLCFLD